MAKLSVWEGKRYGRWTAIGRSHLKKRWLFRCDCGTEKHLIPAIMTRARQPSKSCGCLASELIAKRNTTHGMSKNCREYRIWVGIRRRCEKPTEPAYPLYGGRGISVCERWQDFVNFYADMGPAPAKKTLDRIDNDGNYEPGNCRWATTREQARNRRANRIIEINGETHCLVDWAELCGVPHARVSGRLRYGWSPEEALELVPRVKWARTRRAVTASEILREVTKARAL